MMHDNYLSNYLLSILYNLEKESVCNPTTSKTASPEENIECSLFKSLLALRAQIARSHLDLVAKTEFSFCWV